jgi:hypothetical protein
VVLNGIEEVITATDALLPSRLQATILRVCAVINVTLWRNSCCT